MSTTSTEIPSHAEHELTGPSSVLRTVLGLLKDSNSQSHARARALLDAGAACLALGRFAHALDHFAAGRALAEDLDLAHVRLSCQIGIAVAQQRSGRIADSAHSFLKTLVDPKLTAHPLVRATALTHQGVLFGDLGRHAEALELQMAAGDGLDECAEIFPEVASNRACVLLDLMRARAAIDTLMPLTNRPLVRWSPCARAQAFAELGRAHFQLGLFDAADSFLKESVMLARDHESARSLAIALSYRAELQMVRGEHDSAMLTASESCEMARQQGRIALLRKSLGIMLRLKRAQGSSADVIQILSERDELSSILLRQQAELSINLEEPAPRAENRPAHPDEKQVAERLAKLTPNERRILGLVVHGMTNKVIGQRLKISHHTVRHVISSITDKLGVRNRTDATRLALTPGLGLEHVWRLSETH